MKFEVDCIELNGQLSGRIFNDQKVTGIEGCYIYGKNWGNEIPLNSIFTCINLFQSGKIIPQFSGLKIKVVEIVLWGQAMESVSKNFTARLKIEGHGLKNILKSIASLEKDSCILLEA